MTKDPRTRKFTMTCNNYTYNDIAVFMENALETEYSVCGFEYAPTTGTPHLQCFIYYKNARYLSAVKKIFPRYIVFKSNGSPISNCGYCTKDGDYWEHGELPQQGKVKFRDVEYVMKNPKSHLTIYNQYRKSYAEYKYTQVSKKKRKMYGVSIDSMSQYLVNYSPTQVLVFPDDIDVYSGEKCIFHNWEIEHVYGKSPVSRWRLWKQGYPFKIKKGYMDMYVDPDIVYFVYSNDNQMFSLQEFFPEIKILDNIELIESENEYWNNI